MKKLAIIFCFLTCALYAQDRTIDSLQMELKKAKHDTVKANTMNLIIQSIQKHNLDSAILLAKLNLLFVQNSNLISQEIKTLNILGDLMFKKNDFSKSKEFYNNSLSKAINLKKKIEIGNCYYGINRCYYSEANYPLALNFLLNALRQYSSINNVEKTNTCYFGLTNIYIQQKQYEQALKYNTILLSNLILSKDSIYIARVYANYSVIYGEKMNLELALKFGYKSMKLFQKNKNNYLLGYLYNNISGVFERQNKIDSAIIYQIKTIEIRTVLNDEVGLGISYSNLADLYNMSNLPQKAKKYGLNAIDLTMKTGDVDTRIFTLGVLSETFFKLEDYKQAYKYQKEYKLLNDSIFNIENSERLSELKIDFEIEKVNDIMEAKLLVKRNQQYFVYSCLALVLLFSVFMYNRFRVTQKQKIIIELKEQEAQKQNSIITEQKHLVEQKHKEITESVDYAERIQKGFLVSKEFLNKFLKTGFILFKPKDKVSGDFYWSESLKNGNLAVCIADSTGHGVPGAFMSLLNMSLLNESILSKNYTNTADILNFVRKILILGIKPNEKGEGGNDGMDCVLFSINYNTLELEFTGANNSLWIVREVVGESNNQSKITKNLIELKGDKMPVGRSMKADISFTSQTFQLQKGDVIYASTDGYIDQFGGPKEKKFMSKQLKEVLLSICHLHEDEQKEKLITLFENWKGSLEQVDDVTIMGIKI